MGSYQPDSSSQDIWDRISFWKFFEGRPVRSPSSSLCTFVSFSSPRELIGMDIYGEMGPTLLGVHLDIHLNAPTKPTNDESEE